MTALILTYLLWIIIWEHWGGSGTTDKIIFWIITYAWFAALSLTHYKRVKGFHLILIAILFACLSVNELTCLGLTPEQYEAEMNGPGPVFGLTIFAVGLFIIYEIIHRWKRNKLA